MSHKSRGINAERDLIHKFWSQGWAALRAAGSGSSKYPSPDIVASNNVRKLAIEAKLTTEKKKYFTGKEIQELIIFAQRFGAEAWTAIKFYHQPWYFLSTEDLEATKSSYGVTLPLAQRRGLTFEEIITL
ncbi:Holliday junction resolvase [Candidatus Woesearchaeota archaeon]|nr:Holliday junction resolvase [Candidatus Woesearchaeota archaeon]